MYLNNNNGESYKVLAFAQSGNENGNNVYLLKTAQGNYIVALGWSEKFKSWSNGHYHMGNKEAAIDDFNAQARKIAWYAIG